MIAILVTGVRVPGGALFLWFKCHIKMCAVKKKKRISGHLSSLSRCLIVLLSIVQVARYERKEPAS